MSTVLAVLSIPDWRRGRPTDIYALGACLFTFVYGRIPFSAPTVYQLFQVVQTEPLRFPEEPLVSDDLKDLLTQMLIKVTALRLYLQKPAVVRFCANSEMRLWQDGAAAPNNT